MIQILSNSGFILKKLPKNEGTAYFACFVKNKLAYQIIYPSKKLEILGKN